MGGEGRHGSAGKGGFCFSLWGLGLTFSVFGCKQRVREKGMRTRGVDSGIDSWRFAGDQVFRAKGVRGVEGSLKHADGWYRVVRLVNRLLASSSVGGLSRALAEGLSQEFEVSAAQVWLKVEELNASGLSLESLSEELELMGQSKELEGVASPLRIGVNQSLAGFVSTEGVRYRWSALDTQSVGWSDCQWAASEGYLSGLSVPLVASGRRFGALVMWDRSSRVRMNEDHAQVIADAASVTLWQLRRLQSMDRQVQWLTGLQQVTGLVASRVSLEDLYRLIFEQVARILPVSGFWIGLYDAKENSLMRVLSVDAQGGRYRFQGGDAEEGIEGTVWARAVRMREPILINRRLPAVPQDEGGEERRRASSVMIVPMLVGEQVVGVMSAESFTPSAYDEEALDVLNTVANQAALAIENARLLDRLNRQIVETNKANRLKTQFLANISHEVRTPLNAILGFTRILKRHGDGYLPPDQMENVDRILESTEHLMQLIEDLLDLSRLEVGRMTLAPDAVDVRRLVARAMAEMEPLIEDTGNQVEAEIGPDALTVVTDATRVRQILLNLLSNAVKFTHGGRIVVRTGRPSSLVPEEAGWQYFGPVGKGIPGERALGAGSAPGLEKVPYFFLEVSDTGVGMNAGVVADLFGEFQQGSVGDSRLYGGTGLGLSIVQRIAGLMRGIIWVKTSPGEGSTFRVLLQELLGRPPSPAPAGRETHETGSGSEPTGYPAR